MPRSPIYKIGQEVVAIRRVFNPHTQTDHPTGSVGKIVGVGVDSQFGFYVVEINGETFMTDVAPVSKNACLKIKD